MLKSRFLAVLLILTWLTTLKGASAQVEHNSLLIPLGNGDPNTYEDLFLLIDEPPRISTTNILLLPIAYGTTSSISTEDIRQTLENACNNVVTSRPGCQTTLAPDLIFETNREQDVLDAISDDLSAILLLSNDSKRAMKAISGTEVEQALEQAYQRGILIAGESGAGNMLSRTIIRGYAPGFSAEQALQFGAVDIGFADLQGGLSFGLQNGIIDTNLFRAGNVGRLINAISSPESSHVGLGIDAFSGAGIEDQQRIAAVLGLYTTAIFDAETYQSANAAQYRGAKNFTSIHNVLFHLIPPSEYTYNLSSRQHSLSPPLTQLQRTPLFLDIPEGAGVMILSGGLDQAPKNHKILRHFINLSGGRDANIAIVASGFATDRAARNAVEEYQSKLGVATTPILISGSISETPLLPEGTSGILVIGKDPSRFMTELLPDISSLWLKGIPVLADDAAAVAMGVYYNALEPTPDTDEEAEALTQEVLIQGQNTILPGLGLVNAMIEPRIFADNRWARLFSLTYNHPDFIALGLNRDTAIYIAPEAMTIEGDNVAISVDLRTASLALGINGGYVIANGLLDVFAPGEVLHFQNANANSVLIHASTPSIPTATFTTTPTKSPTLTPTLTATPPPPTNPPKVRPPTRTPLPTPMIPPPMDANLTNAMIIVGVFAVIAVFIGYWLNRGKL
jgi:cyanophycinase-like exopeptidase